jgi:hypothetical protein
MIEEAWRSGRLGADAPTAGKLGGHVVEMITRHRLRLGGATEEEEREEGRGEARLGCTIFLWVPAHEAGIVANVYADAIAKSHLAEPPTDIFTNTLPRACVYATTDEGGGRMWMAAADRSLRRMVIEGVTRTAVEEMRDPGRSTPG